MSKKRKEIAGLVRLLHEHMNNPEIPCSFVRDDGSFDDYPDALLERLRCLTDAEYAECAYGSEDGL